MDNLLDSGCGESVNPGEKPALPPQFASLAGRPVSSWVRLIHRVADVGSGWILCVALVFSPWAFGSTTDWAIEVTNVAGWLLGFLLALKWLSRRVAVQAHDSGGLRRSSKSRRWITRALAAVTILIVAYCLIGALNARAGFNPQNYQFQTHGFIPWLPSSFDSAATWKTLRACLCLVLTFWAVRDWLLGGAIERSRERRRSSDSDTRSPRGGAFLSGRLGVLVWILSLNSALLAIQGLAQRALGGTRLLWLIEPHINKTTTAQFGPYAYRSNAAAYFLLAWPLILGLWWALRRAVRASQRGWRPQYFNYLLPCLLLAASVPIFSLSRAGLILGSLSILAALAVLLSVHRQSRAQTRYYIFTILSLAFCLSLAIEWKDLTGRLENDSLDSGRLAIWENTWRMARDYPLFGTGPGSFSSVYFLYRSQADDDWCAQAHNDWLEILATFGTVGTTLLLVAFGLAVGLVFTDGGFPADRVFVGMLWLALGTCLLFASVDFPLQITSIRFLFVIECAILSVVSRPKTQGKRQANSHG